MYKYYYLFLSNVHQDGHTPLSWACQRGLSDVAKLLINKGASFDVTDAVSYYFYIKGG